MFTPALTSLEEAAATNPPFIPRGMRHNLRPSAPAFIPRSQNSYYRLPFGGPRFNAAPPVFVPPPADFYMNQQPVFPTRPQYPPNSYYHQNSRNFQNPRGQKFRRNLPHETTSQQNTSQQQQSTAYNHNIYFSPEQKPADYDNVGATSYEFQSQTDGKRNSNGQSFGKPVGRIRDVREIEAAVIREERQHEDLPNQKDGSRASHVRASPDSAGQQRGRGPRGVGRRPVKQPQFEDQSSEGPSKAPRGSDARAKGRQQLLAETSHLLKSMGMVDTPKTNEVGNNYENYSGNDRGGVSNGKKQNWMSWRQRDSADAQSRPFNDAQSRSFNDAQSRPPPNCSRGKPDDQKPAGKTQHSHNSSSPRTPLVKPLFKFNDVTSDSLLNSQRDRLAQQLRRGKYECMVCYEFVRQSDRIWHCSQCYNIFHLKCIVRWSKSQEHGQDWRCPACQEEKQLPPGKYKCFCGKYEDPQWDRYLTPHTCGEVCSLLKPRSPQCTHPCTLLCHPGPCPPCKVNVNRKCPCGKTTSKQVCGEPQNLGCGNKCEKKLKCGEHFCERLCHLDDCDTCDNILQKVCYCSKSTQDMSCTRVNNENASFSCASVCSKILACNNHECGNICHPGDCAPCALLPSAVTTCWCGHNNLTDILAEPRTTCLQPVPSCGNLCNKLLDCGPQGEKHRCEKVCHEGNCPPCQNTTTSQCMCGHKKMAVPCSQLSEGFLCDKKCNKRLTCLRHKCLKVCCTEDFHVCPQICNRTLSCGLHKCERLCHAGNCPPCQNTSFEELFCRCGHSKIFPPVSCGTKRPECDQPCKRQHSCDHEPLHNCHDQPECPPCFVLGYKWCYGRHELRKAVPCHTTGLSCGRPCKGELPCQRHTCTRNCHEGTCLREGQICSQPCLTKRPFCGHPCSAPCHAGPCPDTPCTQQIKVSCECKHRSLNRNCCDNTKEYQIMSTSLLASTMADLQLGHSVDIGESLTGQKAWKDSLKSLECNAECKIQDRNRKMAMALQIRNPDLSQKLTPRYSEFMRKWAKKDPDFVQRVHDRLTELVSRAKHSKQKTRSYSFEVMNRDKRQFVHEYCALFGCESVAYDEEPKRNVVATASKDDAWLPSMGLLEVMQRESGLRKVPAPTNDLSGSQPSEARRLTSLTKSQNN